MQLTHHLPTNVDDPQVSRDRMMVSLANVFAVPDNAMTLASDSPLGELVRKHRLTAAISQDELAERSGVSVRTISDLERGIRETARLETVRLLATGLDLDESERAAFIAAAIRGMVVASPEPQPELQTAQLPPSPNTVIGRERLIHSLLEIMLAGDERIITLTGPGGVGKTRVAIEAASRWSDQLNAPVTFVSLAPLTDVRRVAPVIARSLGIPQSIENPEDSVLVHLACQHRMLLVLDNFEHLLGASEFVAKIGSKAPGVTILLTSRARLRLSAEREVPVEPLDVPGREAGPDAILASGSVRLFRERARDVADDLALDGSDVRIVGEICRRVDGLPLAIELAASKLRVMPADRLLSLLETRLPILTGGHRDSPQRHQSMRDTITWTYDSLSDREQRLFRWLSVFVGGISSDSVAGTGASMGWTEVETFHVLEGLSESGLVRRVPGYGAARFQMLETIREYGMEALENRGELNDAWLSFVHVIQAYCSRGASLHQFNVTTDWLAGMDRESANFDAALNTACASGSPGSCATFIALAGQYWSYRGPLREGALRLRTAVGHLSPTPDGTTTLALISTAVLSMYAGDYEIAKETGESARDMAIALGDRRLEAGALHKLGWNAELSGDWSKASELFEQSIAFWQELGEIGSQGQSYMLLGGHAYVRGDYAEARRLEQKASEIFIESGATPDWLGATEWYLGFIDMAEQKVHDAARRFERSLESWLAIEERTHHFKPIIHLADVAAAVGDYETAATLAGCCDHLLEQSGGVLFPFDAPASERVRQQCREALGEQRFAELHHAARTLGPADWLQLAADVVERTAP